MTATKDAFFKPEKMNAQQKASATNDAVSQILAAETAERLKKTDRLREARLAREAEAQTVIAPPPPSRKRAAKPVVA